MIGVPAHLLRPLHHPGHGVAEPALELLVAGKHGGHQEVHEAPQLHQVVLQRRAYVAWAVWTKQQGLVFCVRLDRRAPQLHKVRRVIGWR